MGAPEPGERRVPGSPLLKPWVPGLTFGRYTVMGKLAIGGMAEIWLARQAGPKGFEKVVVIKKILDSYGTDEGFVDMFLDEARIAAQLNHPNVVQIYDLGEHERAYFIAMEYLAGETVGRVARAATKSGHPLPYAYAARLISDAAAGLGYAHAKKSLSGKPLNVVHRDVSPQNLILTYEGQLKVLDFGVARAANRAALTEEGKFKGKVPYMSPEQARAEPVDGRADIFALGIILYELIGRCRLFLNEDFVQGLKAVASDDPIPSPITRNPDVPPALAAIALKALERRPENRYQTGEQFRAALEEWLRTQPDAPGAPELAAFMHQLFATRIEQTVRLIESARAGIEGVLDANAAKLDGPPSGEASMPGSSSAAAAAAAAPPRSKGLLWVLLGAGVVAVALVAVAIAAARPPARMDVAVVEVAPPPVVVPASLSIDTDPPGAMVTVDDVAVGAAPVSVDAVKLGSHKVRATADDFEPAERTIEVQRDGERTNLVLTLKPAAPKVTDPVPLVPGEKGPRAAPKGKLTLSTTPWSHVYEGSKKLGETPLVEIPLPAGKHSLRLTNDEHHLTKTITVEIKSGKVTLLREKL